MQPALKEKRLYKMKWRSYIKNIWDFVNEHELSKYPVAQEHKIKVQAWLNNILGLGVLEHPLNDFKNDHTEEEFIFKTYERCYGEYVTLLEENKSIFGHGTTGLTSWQGALMLTDWFVINNKILKGKRIIELGSGVGLLGIHLLKTCPDILEYTFTDTHHNVLNFLNYNIHLNLTQTPTYYRIQKDNPEKDSVSLRKLDWNTGLPKYNLREFDVILGSDIVYERSLIPPLVGVLKTAMDIDSKRRAYIACTERSQTTLDIFETEILNNGLRYEILYKGMYSPRENILNSDVQHQRTRIYEIQSVSSLPADENQSRTL
ncbi:EEF2KMT [Lepeophtheirus salmonis]|uniref:EEF2KMT n=1 Tax=Lepeophtheirus salmonis TaxID=72036 RepID=A0A7R8D4U8_LEPSM|nr:EEF2KMT [Lepeophtheirus salmonis]CAF3029307.1 EEF2KMT [Lepeophtheirus salmonis]